MNTEMAAISHGRGFSEVRQWGHVLDLAQQTIAMRPSPAFIHVQLLIAILVADRMATQANDLDGPSEAESFVILRSRCSFVSFRNTSRCSQHNVHNLPMSDA